MSPPPNERSGRRITCGRIPSSSGRETRMAFVEWTMKGTEYGHCNCNTGCPCQFNSLPSHGNCRAHSFFQIERGKFGDVTLDGLRWGFLAAWPGPIHMGGGTAVTVIEER